MKPTKQQCKLVSAIASALAEYHNELHADFACHAQAAKMVVDGFGLTDVTVKDFFSVREVKVS